MEKEKLVVEASLSHDPSGSDSGLAPVTDETAESPEHDQDATGQGTTSKPTSATPDGAGNVCCFALPGSINSVPQMEKEGWTRVGVTIDSGAADSAAAPESFPGYAVIQHSAPQFYQSATGEPIVNVGEQMVTMVTGEGALRGMKFQASKKIKKPLASVK